MQGLSFWYLIKLGMFFTLIMGLMMVAYEDGTPFALFKKLRCRFGWHKIRSKIGKVKTNVYYCRFCKKPRNHPELKVVDGGRKVLDTKFRF